MIYHITMTGRYAGMPLCDIKRAEADKEKHEFFHAPYAPLKDWKFKDELCPKCKAVWTEE